MSNINVKSKDHKIVGNKILVTQTTEKEFTKQELQNELIKISASKNQLLQQNKRLVLQYNSLCRQEEEITALLATIPEEEIEKL